MNVHALTEKKKKKLTYIIPLYFVLIMWISINLVFANLVFINFQICKWIC